MFDLPAEHWLVLMSALLGVIGASAYIRDTIAGKTKPNRVSWCMWALAPLAGAAAAVDAGADQWATIRIFLGGFLPLLVFISSFFNRRSYWQLTAFDVSCGILSFLALIMWGTMHSPRTAILLLASADAFASIPTLKKTWTNPETETAITYVLSFISVVLVVPSIPVWNIENSAFQIYLLVSNTLLLFCVFRMRLKTVARS